VDATAGNNAASRYPDFHPHDEPTYRAMLIDKEVTREEPPVTWISDAIAAPVLTVGGRRAEHIFQVFTPQ